LAPGLVDLLESLYDEGMPPTPVPVEDDAVAVASSALSWGYVTLDDRPPGWLQNLPTVAEAWGLAHEEYAEREFFESEGVDWDADDVQIEEGAGQRFALVSQRIARGLADPGACSVVDELVDLDPLLLPEDERIDLVVALEKQLTGSRPPTSGPCTGRWCRWSRCRRCRAGRRRWSASGSRWPRPRGRTSSRWRCAGRWGR
jgi:hypothetical protein